MNYKEKAIILRVCSSKKGERCSRCPAFGQGSRNCFRNAMKDGATAITELLERAEKAEQRAKNAEKKFRDFVYAKEDSGDEITAERYITEHSRMCHEYKSLVIHCPRCPMQNEREKMGDYLGSCEYFVLHNPEIAVRVVAEWSRMNPPENKRVFNKDKRKYEIDWEK